MAFGADYGLLAGTAPGMILAAPDAIGANAYAFFSGTLILGSIVLVLANGPARHEGEPEAP